MAHEFLACCFTNRVYREQPGLSDEAARHECSELVALGMLTRQGKGRNPYYVLKTLGN